MLRSAKFPLSSYILGCFVAGSLAACSEPTSTAPDDAAQLAKAPAAPSVTSASPSSSGRPATLDVRILGRNFDRGSAVAFALDGVINSKMVVNSTRYVKSSELVASLTIAADAPVAQYDVVVTLSTGAKATGNKLFSVISILDLGLSGNGDARDVNSSGIVVGDYQPPGSTVGCRRAFVWTHLNGARDLPLPQSGCSSAVSINDAGVIVGHVRGGTVLRWSPEGGPEPWTVQAITGPPGFTLGGGGAVDLNEAGAILAMYTATDGTFLPFLHLETGWVPLAISSDVSCWSGGGYVTALNEANQVVGGDCANALVWPDPEGSPLKLPGPAGVDRLSAMDINDGGVIAGKSRLVSSGARRAVRWEPDGAEGWAYGDIGDLGGGSGEAGANSINNAGQVSGWSTASTGNSQQRAFLWTPGTPMKALGSLSTGSTQALAVSNPGLTGGPYLSGWSLSGSKHRAVRWAE